MAKRCSCSTAPKTSGWSRSDSNSCWQWAMSLPMRVLLLLLLASCGVSEATAPKSSVSLSTWLTRWEQARTCMVYPAEDLRIGIAVSMLVGRDCSSEIGVLPEPFADVPAWRVAASLAEDLPAARTPTRRAMLIDAIDRQVEPLGIA